MNVNSPTALHPSEPTGAAALSRGNGSAGPAGGVAAEDRVPTLVPPSPRRSRLPWRIVASLLLVGALFMGWRAMTSHAKSPTAALPAPARIPVPVAPAARADLFNEVTIPAEFRPYLEVELHAKVSGYLEQMSVDIGDRVKAGQLLATLDAPDLVAQLNNAIATLRRSEADYTNAHLIYERMVDVNQQAPGTESQQDLDTASAKDQTAAAVIAAAKADVDRYQTLVNYMRITAPFDGVITHRYADPGALIQAGTASETQSMPLVRISDNYKLRLDTPISQTYVKDIHVGDSVEVRIQSLDNKRIIGKITRTTQRVDDATRTMLAEVEVDNPNLEIIPGMYARVFLKVQNRPHTIAIPTGAVPPENKGQVYVVDSHGRVETRHVVLGLETPNQWEVVSGLKEGELVMLGKWTQITPGQMVEPKVVEPLVEE